MYGNNLIAGIFTLACFIMLIPSLGTAQTGDVKASMATLKAETDKLGDPELKAATFISGTTRQTSRSLQMSCKNTP